MLPNRVSACIVFCSTVLLGTCTYLARHYVVRVFTEDVQIRAATAAVVPAVAASIVGEFSASCFVFEGGVHVHSPVARTHVECCAEIVGSLICSALTFRFLPTCFCLHTNAVWLSPAGDGMVAVLSSVLRASGRQAIGAVFNIGGYWVLCLPLAWFLGFNMKFG